MYKNQIPDRKKNPLRSADSHTTYKMNIIIIGYRLRGCDIYFFVIKIFMQFLVVTVFTHYHNIDTLQKGGIIPLVFVLCIVSPSPAIQSKPPSKSEIKPSTLIARLKIIFLFIMYPLCPVILSV